MAEKKPDKKVEKKEPQAPSAYFLLALLFLGLFLLSQLMNIVGVLMPGLPSTFNSLIVTFISSLQVFAAFISLLFVMGIMYANFRIGQIKREAKLKEKVDSAKDIKTQKEEQTENKKWKRIVEHVSSSNPSDWRLSVLEADILLSDALKERGYQGETIADMLKSTNKDNFKTLDEAWEAHKIRNSIAHEGSEFVLSQREAKRVVSLFEDVFRELYFI
ncbi:MAG: hypothetical protein WC629_01955 [Candidatus Paceibacterota bacterium]|jgi:hypothetical protein